MKNITFYLLLTVLFFFVSCTKNSELESGGFKLSLRSIDKFEINSVYNEGIVNTTYSAVIDEDHKLITLSLPMEIVKNFPADTSITLIPSLSISRNANVVPKNLNPITLKFKPQSTDSLLYTLISEDGRKAVYTVRWNFEFKYKGAQVLCYEFPDVIDPQTGSPLRTSGAPTWMLYPKSWFTYSIPAVKDKYGDEIGYVKMRIILTPESMNASLFQPDVSEGLVSGTKYFQNPTRLSLTDPFNCNRNYKQPLYTFTITSEDGKKTTSNSFTLHWDTTK